MPKKARKRAAVAQEKCVACGCCVPVCPKGAASLYLLFMHETVCDLLTEKDIQMDIIEI